MKIDITDPTSFIDNDGDVVYRLTMTPPPSGGRRRVLSGYAFWADVEHDLKAWRVEFPDHTFTVELLRG